jgi:hypothetical protein
LPILGWLFTSQGFWGKIVPCLGSIELRDSRKNPQKIGKNEGNEKTEGKKERKKEKRQYLCMNLGIYMAIYLHLHRGNHIIEVRTSLLCYSDLSKWSSSDETFEAGNFHHRHCHSPKPPAPTNQQPATSNQQPAPKRQSPFTISPSLD